MINLGEEVSSEPWGPSKLTFGLHASTSFHCKFTNSNMLSSRFEMRNVFSLIGWTIGSEITENSGEFVVWKLTSDLQEVVEVWEE